ncbi:hypothetical protein BJ165DRAFT_333287 [Panaeolus papilionaceus]|nr:hypothetical protein BJ165DRAFT_333287 [Panaeolus papilionaceus]
MSTTTMKYHWIQVNGPIRITPITPEQLKGKYIRIYILMGPTGSGKSSFIESFAPDQQLNISKDSLESVTQEVNCYQVVNTSAQYSDSSFVLMDTPGFLDPRLSEGRITRMVTESLEAFRQYSSTFYVYIFYFQPITDIRMSGSKQDAVKILREYVKRYNAAYITVITTMWNTLGTPKQLEDAKHRMDTFKNEIYASSQGLDINVTKFDTSQASALSLLNGSLVGWDEDEMDPNEVIDRDYQSLLCNNLLGRITNLLQQLQFIAENKRSATRFGTEDHRLLEVVLRDEKVAVSSLQSFLEDLVRINPPGLTSESWDDASIFHIDISEFSDLASDDTGPSGIMVLQCLLDGLYDQKPDACSSPWPFFRASPLAQPGVQLPPDAALQPVVTSDSPSNCDSGPASPSQVPGLHQLSHTPRPIPSAAHGQPPSPNASCFAPIAAAIKRQFNHTRG